MSFTHNNRRDREWNELEVAKKIRFFKRKKISADIVRAACNLCFHDDDIDNVIMEFASQTQKKDRLFKRKIGAGN